MTNGSHQNQPSDEPLDAEKMLRAEFAHVLDDPRWNDRMPLNELLLRLHAAPAEQRPSALCLSGGGIRSATFCLGVLQWLAAHGRLKDFHYLSTVSGGGYIGSWLVNGLWQAGAPIVRAAELAGAAEIQEAEHARSQALVAAERRASPTNNEALIAAEAGVAEARIAAERRSLQSAEAAAAATDEWLRRVGQSAGSVGAASASGAARTGGDAPDPVAPLRAFSNYLSPTGGLSGDAFSLAAIFVRNLLLNALVWLPVLSVLVALPRLYIAVLGYASSWTAKVQLGVLDLTLIFIVIGVVYIVADLPAPRTPAAVPTAPTARARKVAAAAAAGSMVHADWFFWVCFLPIVCAAVVLSVGGSWIEALRDIELWKFALAGAVAHLLGVFVGVGVRLMRGNALRKGSVWGVVAVVTVGAFGGALASLVLSRLGYDSQSNDLTDTQRLLYASFAVPAMTGAFWLAMALYAGLMGRLTDEQDREWWARATAAWLKFSLLWILVFALTVWLPLPILDYFGNVGPTAVQFGVGSGVLGILTSLIGYWSKSGGDLKRKAQGFLRVTRLRLLDAMAGLVVLTTLLALSLAWSAALDRCHGWNTLLCDTDLHAQTEFLREQAELRAAQREDKGVHSVLPSIETTREAIDDGRFEVGLSAPAQVYLHVLRRADVAGLTVSVLALGSFAAFLSWTMGVNVFSLHGMYGNRLVRAYLGSGRAVRHPHWFTGFDPDDNPPLREFSTPLRHPTGAPRLFPVINIALNLVRPSAKHLDWQQRKAAPFIATPLHCGGAAVGFRSTERYAGGMSLGRALTISGAAASPNMGYHSSPLVTFVMTLFNVRLGWWSPNPGPASGDRWTQEQPRLGLDVAIAEAGGSTGDDDKFVYLSDGGHFDNLGIYEMVRRRCHRIVVVDATADGKFTYGDLLDVVRKVRVDLGIPIELPSVLPGPGRDTTHARLVEARIRYSARDGNPIEQDGTLLVLKPRLVPEKDPPELASYAAASAPDGSPVDDPTRFPHQSTADQFFDEQQFESYRLLGYETAADALDPQTPAQSKRLPRLGRRRAAALVQAPVVSTDSAAGRPANAGSDDTRAAGVAGLASAAGVGRFVQQVGAGTAFATALTIGGTLGVAGTVALAPAELTLSSTDRALLKDGLSLRVADEEFKLNGDDRRLLRDGVRVAVDNADTNVSAERLTVAGNALNAAAAHLATLTLPNPATASAPAAGPPVLDPRLLKAVQDLQGEIAQLKDRIRGKTTGGDDLTSAVAKLQQTLQLIERKLPSDPQIVESLNRMSDAIAQIAPRRNVRGQDGSAR